MDCLQPVGELIRCLEAIEDEIGNRQCIKCVSDFQFIYSIDYNKNICDDKCDPVSFFKWGWCHKCDDKYYGNPGCLLEEGCNYKSGNDELDCKICKSGYFNYTYGQCFSCSKENYPCIECHLNTSRLKFECDKCIDGFVLIEEDKKCVVNTCDEYPEVTQGCIICLDKVNQLKPQNKCEACKKDFFKTKDESCVYCKARNNGGPACELCEYAKYENGTETNEIRCKYCPQGNILSSDGKCYNCKNELGIACNNCTFVKDENKNNSEKLVCNECLKEYNLSPNKHCIHFQSYYKLIPHCANYYYNINIRTNDINNEMNEDMNNGMNNNTQFNNTFGGNDNFEGEEGEGNENMDQEGGDGMPPNDFIINSFCERCKDGYFLNSNGTCENLSVTDCSFMSILSNSEKKYYSCNNFCDNKKFSKIIYTLGNVVNNLQNSSLSEYADYLINYINYNYGYNITSVENLFDEEISKIRLDLDNLIKIYGINNDYLNYLDNNIKSLLYNIYLCLRNSGSGLKNEPTNLKKCKKSEYIESNNTYVCIECISGYSLDIETNLCKQSIKISMNLRPGISNCYVENIGTKSNPIYSCKYCYNYDNILIKGENGAKFCEKPENELEGCTEATADTSHLNNLYNCTNCIYGYIPYYSRFFKRKICQHIYLNITRYKEFDSEAFNDDVEYINSTNGICENKFFTPDGKRCYLCNNRAVGMVGCKGICTFSQKRNNVIECEEGGCKTGYLEKTKGICEPCDTVNVGCIECHYEDNYLNDYVGFKRSKRFVCDTCEEGFLKSEDGTCHNCTELGFYNCEKCKRDTNNDNDLICYQCSEGYFLTENGECTKCNENQVRGNSNTCINCDDVEEGGLEGCKDCKSENDSIICEECKEGFLLLKNNKTCLKISENNELEEFINCQQLYLDENNKLYCSKCIDNYILLNENNIIKCVSKDFIPSAHPNLNYLCNEFINLGTEDKPKYSCKKCNEYKKINKFYYDMEFYDRCKRKCYDIEQFDNCVVDCYNSYKTSITKIKYEDNNTAFCNYSNYYEKLENCTEATLKEVNGIIKLNCTKCNKNSNLTYHKDTNSNICRYIHYEKNCVVKYCKTCEKDNNYFCKSCLPTDYEVSPITGSCVKKMPKPPLITWKDIYRLQMNQQRVISGRPIYGPSLMMRGFTTSQINTGHAFLIYMTFKIKYSRNYRNLEEEKKIPTICQILDSVDESEDDVNMIEYDCIGNLTEEENDELKDYKLNNIEESNNEENSKVIGTSNLQEIIKETNLENIETKNKSICPVSSVLKWANFIADEINNQTSDNLAFNFEIKGKINKDLESQAIDVKLPISEIKDKNADCIFNIKENRKANLNCSLNIENYKDYKILSFKKKDLKSKEDYDIMLSKIDEVLLINDYQEKEKEIEEEIEKEEKNNNKLIIIITVVAILVILIINIIIFIIILKRCKKKKIVDNQQIEIKTEKKYLGERRVNSRSQFQTINEEGSKEK